MKLSPGMTLGQMAEQMGQAGVLGARRFARAVEILTEMFGERGYVNFLAAAGPVVPSGLRLLIGDLIKRDLIHGVVTTGANVTHDIVEGLGHRHAVGLATANDTKLRKRNISRIYDIYISQKAIEDLEKRIYKMLDQIPEERRRGIATYELLWEFGRRLRDRNSILKIAQEKEAPIFCPGIYDSMLGLHLWTYSQLKPLYVNPMLDFGRLVDMSFSAKRIGAIILGGGMPKHHVLVASIFRGGIDSAIQITLDRPEGGGTSGAPLEEAISWGKVKTPRRLMTVIGDATALFPMIAVAALEKVTDRVSE